MQLATLAQPEDIFVLLIEDSSADATELTKSVLYGESLYNFQIIRKASLSDALHFLKSTTVDVVLLDLNLPDAKELRAIEEVHSTHPELPIVVISGYSDMNIIHNALRGGAQEFLIKGECSGSVVRQSMYQAIVRKKIERSYERGEKL